MVTGVDGGAKIALPRSPVSLICEDSRFQNSNPRCYQGVNMLIGAVSQLERGGDATAATRRCPPTV